MEEEPAVNQSTSGNKIKKLKSEISSLKGKFEDVKREMYEKKKRIQETTEQIRERVSPQTGPWYLLVQYRNGEWVQFGKYDSPEELKRAANEVKDLRRKKNSNIKNYYVTDSEKEMRKIVKIQVHRERKYHEEMKTELRGQPYSRISENIQRGLKIQEPKQISKEIERYSGYSGKPSGMMPRMSVGVWGSISQPRKTNLAPGRTTKQPMKRQKTVIPHDQYKELLDSGYSKEQLEEMGVVDKYSRFYQDKSEFPGAVPYKPISLYQSFVKVNPPKTIYQKRISRGEAWEGFKPITIGSSNFRPFVVGLIDPLTGERRTNFRPKKIYL